MSSLPAKPASVVPVRIDPSQGGMAIPATQNLAVLYGQAYLVQTQLFNAALAVREAQPTQEGKDWVDALMRQMLEAANAGIMSVVQEAERQILALMVPAQPTEAITAPKKKGFWDGFWFDPNWGKSETPPLPANATGWQKLWHGLWYAGEDDLF